MTKFRWDRGDVDRVAEESLDVSLDRVGCEFDAGSVGDEDLAGLADFFFLPSPNSDRFFAFSSVLGVFSDSIMARAVSSILLGSRYGRDCPRTMVALSARLMADVSEPRP